MPAFVSLFALAVLTNIARAAPAPEPVHAPMGLALYSDACVNQESSDMMGTRIGVLRLNRGYDLYILYQDAEGGGFDKPDFIQLDSGKGETVEPNISFTVNWNGKPDTFHGAITDKMIVGEFANARHTNGFERREFRLPRVSLNQAGYPDCKASQFSPEVEKKYQEMGNQAQKPGRK